MRPIGGKSKPTRTAPPDLAHVLEKARSGWPPAASRPQNRRNATSQHDWLRGIWLRRVRGHPCRPA
eukprot:6497082-Alexandrium_andersonii.AAC.1